MNLYAPKIIRHIKLIRYINKKVECLVNTPLFMS